MYNIYSPSQIIRYIFQTTCDRDFYRNSKLVLRRVKFFCCEHVLVVKLFDCLAEALEINHNISDVIIYSFNTVKM